jgi:segregation and condensation protein B
MRTEPAVDTAVATAELLEGPEGIADSESDEAAEGEAPEDDRDDRDEAPDDAAADPENAGAPAAGDERGPEELAGELFALIFASPDPLSTPRLAALVGVKGQKRVSEALGVLATRLEANGLPLVLRSMAGGWRLFTSSEMGEVLGALSERKPDRISPAALETLSIIAYRQPVTKAEIEAIRGVGSGPVLRSLVDRRLARVVGRADQPGAPLLYGTTREFLDKFGLDSLDDLPRDGELNRE